MELLWIYLFIINALGWAFMLADKYKARNNLWRIPEKVLFGTALAGGSLGVYLGMYTARHKTKHPSFVMGIPVIMAVQVLLWLILSN